MKQTAAFELIQKYRKIDVLILDEWLLTELPEDHVMLVLEIIESRLKRASTIFCSQFSPEGWHAKLGLTTALRLFHRCHVFGPLLTSNCSTSDIEKST